MQCPQPKSCKDCQTASAIPGAAVSAEELMAHAARELTSYKRPSEIVILNSLPAASTGLKHKLREAAQAAKSRGIPAVAAHGVA
jgi:acyl-CoA synthetase (AMP-forming)/AMP-acid ligase II